MTYTDLLGDVYLLHFKSEVDQDLAIHTKNHIQDWLTLFFVLPLTSLLHNLHELLWLEFLGCAEGMTYPRSSNYAILCIVLI